MATFTFTLQGTTPTTLGATDKLQFSNGTFNGAITVNAYNGGSHVESSGGSDSSSANTPKNAKYLTPSTVDIGGGSVNLNTISTANCPLKVNFAHGSAVALSQVKFYAYDGTTTTVAPSGVDFKAAKQGDSSWSTVGGSAAALSLADSASNTSHDYYLLVSASPTSVGAKTGKIRMELTYQ